MLIELYIFAFIMIAYGIFITLALFGIERLSHIKNVSDTNVTSQFISIIISARNEENNIEECILQIVRQRFVKEQFEVIIIDDDSEDNTYLLAKSGLEKSGLNYQLIKNTTHLGKKASIAAAILSAKGDIIITSDADVCYRNSYWLDTISNYFKDHSVHLLIMPVDFETQPNALTTFQIIENMALTAITAGYAGIKKPFMCNGANLAFTKQAYVEVGGYESHLHISSGEDVFLLEDLKKLNTSVIHYALHRALIVKTKPQTTLIDFLNQRIRWTYKAKYNSNLLNTIAGLIIVSANLIFPVLLIAVIKKSMLVPYLSIFAISKLVFDFLLLFLTANFLGRTKYSWWILPFECVYWIYALIVGIASLFLKPLWKGKKIN